MTPFSYHTFIFPFTHKGRRKDFKQQYLLSVEEGLYEDLEPDVNKNKESYDQHQYFNQAARNAVYTSKFDDSAVVWNYRYDIECLVTGRCDDAWYSSPRGEDNKARFIIRKGEFSASLAINGVRLKLFNTGVGMLVFELENYEHSTEKAINCINEYGRRVFEPFLNERSDTPCSVCADSITIEYNNTPISEASGPIGKDLAPFINYFLFGAKKAVAKSPDRKEDPCINWIVDDRMFVACIYNNADLVNRMSQWNEREQVYKYIADATQYEPGAAESTARRFYELTFVDGEGISCYNRQMLRDLLESHTYARWLELGTVTGISEYSMVCVTSGLPFVSGAFLTLYVEMVMLALAQRISLLDFEREISNISCKRKGEISQIHEEYLRFQGELLLQEVTAQQQGIELYELLLSSMFIERQQAALEGGIRALFEDNTAKNEKRENRILSILAALTVIDIFNIIGGLFFNPEAVHCWLWSLMGAKDPAGDVGYGLLVLFASVLSIVIIFCLWPRTRRKRK